MCHFVGTVFVGDILEHIGAAVVVEVDIDIGQGDTVGVEEALEKEIVFYGVDLGDAEAVSHSRAGSRTAARAHRYAKPARGGDKVLHN